MKKIKLLSSLSPLPLLLLIFMVFLIPLNGQKLTVKTDEGCSRADSFYLFYKVKVDSVSDSFVLKDYRYEYIYRKKNKIEIDRTFLLYGCALQIYANNRDICVTVFEGECKSYKFVLWLKGALYIIYIDNNEVTKISRSS